ncbi:hypothetical protein EBQ93_03980 [bacterium]|nr:hypothetical protein [bacterium]
MFARAARAAKHTLTAAIASVVSLSSVALYDYDRFFNLSIERDRVRNFTFDENGDFSEKDARSLYDEYKQWMAIEGKYHEPNTTQLRMDGTCIGDGQPLSFDEYGIWEGCLNFWTRIMPKMSPVTNFRRLCTDEEKEVVRTILQDAHQKEEFIEFVLSRVYVMGEESSSGGCFDVANDRIGLAERSITLDAKDRFCILHEILGHFKNNLGHYRALQYSQFLEEMRAEVEAFKGLKKSGFPRRPFVTSDISKSLSVGYVGNSAKFVAILEKESEREQLQEAQGLLEKLQKVEKAERIERT